MSCIFNSILIKEFQIEHLKFVVGMFEIVKLTDRKLYDEFGSDNNLEYLDRIHIQDVLLD